MVLTLLVCGCRKFCFVFLSILQAENFDNVVHLATHMANHATERAGLPAVTPTTSCTAIAWKSLKAFLLGSGILGMQNFFLGGIASDVFVVWESLSLPKLLECYLQYPLCQKPL